MKETTHISITSGSIIKVFLWLCVFAGIFYMREFVVMLLVAVVLASAVEPAIRFLGKYNIPRSLSVVSIFLGIIAFLVTIALIFVPPLADDIAQFLKSLPKLLESIRVFGRDLGFRDLALYIQEISRDISKGQILTVVKNALFGQAGVLATTSVVFNGVFNTFITFVISIYLALEERGVQKFLRLLTPVSAEKYVETMWERAQRKIALWMQGQFLLSFIISLLVYIPMMILGMPYAALLAILAFIGELIPVVGLTIATIPALLLAWVHGGVSLLGTVAVIYLIIGQLENHILYPKIMNRAVGVPSVLIIIAMLIGAKLAGFWGIVLAVPLAAIIMELASDYDKHKRKELF